MKIEEIKKDIADYIMFQFNADEDILADAPITAYMDSIDMVMLVCWVEGRYKITLPDRVEWTHLNDVVKDVERRVRQDEGI